MDERRRINKIKSPCSLIENFHKDKLKFFLTAQGLLVFYARQPSKQGCKKMESLNMQEQSKIMRREGVILERFDK